MRRFTRLFALLAVVTLTAGPAFSAPALVSLTPSIAPVSPAHSHSTPIDLLVWGLGVSALGITIRKDTGSLANKYQTRAQAAQKDYADGVAGAGADWEAATKNSEDAYQQGVTQAIADKRFGKGVTGSAQKYQDNATKLGVQRYSTGVANAAGAWARGMDPVLNTLKSIQLPPKGPRRSPQNQQRANMVATALGALKTGRHA